jgi:hypothetical protein
MAYFVFAVCAALFIGVGILAIKVFRENRKMAPRLKEEEDDEIWS